MGERGIVYNKGMIITPCSYCGKPKPRKPADVKRSGKAAFCDRKCLGKFKSYVNDEKLLSKAVKVESGCMVWQGSRNNSGYGRVRFRGSLMLAHRAAFLAFGGIIGQNDCVLHSCDNPSCVNPQHLFSGNHQANMDDMTAKGRRFTKLTRHQVGEIRESSESSSVLASRYSVSARCVGYARNENNWRPLPSPPTADKVGAEVKDA